MCKHICRARRSSWTLHTGVLEWSPENTNPSLCLEELLNYNFIDDQKGDGCTPIRSPLPLILHPLAECGVCVASAGNLLGRNSPLNQKKKKRIRAHVWARKWLIDLINVALIQGTKPSVVVIIWSGQHPSHKPLRLWAEPVSSAANRKQEAADKEVFCVTGQTSARLW